MAALYKVGIGDTLRIEVKVSDIAVGATYPIETRSLSPNPVWIRRSIAEAAEHIPAPKVFKRGDRVRIVENRGLSAYDIGYDGIVLGRVDREPIRDLGMAASTAVEVNWPDGSVGIYQPSQLEHDEAPE